MKERITAAELKAMTMKELAAWVEFNACAINSTMVMSWGHEELFKGYHIRPEYIGYKAGRLIVKAFHFTSRTRKADAQSFAEWLHWAIFGEYPTEETEETETQTEETEETETEEVETETVNNINRAALMLTQYERYGSVGRDEYIENYINEELKIDISMLSNYNEFLYENKRYDDEFMTWDELEEYLTGMAPLEIFKLAHNSDFTWNDDYFSFNGYGNIVGYDEYQVVKKMDDDDEFKRWYVENYVDLDEEEIEETVNEANKLIAQGY